MIQIEKRRASTIATGQYINLYGKDGVDLFVIINEANGHVDDVKMIQASSYLEDVSAQYNLSEVNLEELELQLEERFFPYGVQIVKK